MSFAESLLKSRGANTVWMVVAPAKGALAWWFVRVDPPKTRQFESAITRGPVHFPDYGMILASGWGSAPPEDVVHEMKRYHGYDPA